MLLAVLEAREHFVMVEVGAGCGRWLVGAALAIRQAHPEMPISLIGIEPEPQHYAWIIAHFRDNGIEPKAHRLIHGAVAAKDGVGWITIGDPAAWYGQSLVSAPEMPMGSHVRETHAVDTYSIETMLAPLTHVDLIGFDVQGEEAPAIAAGINAMSAKVRRAFVETHGAEIHKDVAATFQSAGWKCLHSYGFVGNEMHSTDGLLPVPQTPS